SQKQNKLHSRGTLWATFQTLEPFFWKTTRPLNSNVFKSDSI
ncbi:MAG: hypothetical protein ACJASN_002895, partial [Cyclobacteriaceae bacterium]